MRSPAWTVPMRSIAFSRLRAMLSPIILFNLTLQTISAFLTFTPAYIISRGEGGPLDQTRSIRSICIARRSRILRWDTRRRLPGSCSLSLVS